MTLPMLSVNGKLVVLDKEQEEQHYMLEQNLMEGQHNYIEKCIKTQPAFKKYK